MTGPDLQFRHVLIAVLLMAMGGGALAQSPDELLTRYGRAWHDQPVVYLKLNTTFEIERTATGLKGIRTVVKENITLKPSAGLTEQEEVYYAQLTPLEKINAWTLVPNGNRYSRKPVSRFVHKDVLDDQIFHDDSRSVQFIFPGVGRGAITHLDYELSYADAQLFSGHFFATWAPVEESSLTVICDKTVDVQGVPFQIPEGAIRYEKEEKRGRITHRWTMSKVPPLKSERDAPSILYYAPHMRILIRNTGESPAGDLDRLYAWNRSHVDHLLPDDDTLLVRIAKEETAGLTDDRDKAAKLFAWVQGHIKYIAVEDGMNGLIPAEAVNVCEARYGDCKGMANLLRALMNNAGLTAYLTWVGTRSIPYSYNELPSCVVDNHMVTAWDTGDSLVILDPTSGELPFGMPSGFIQGKQALVGIDRTRSEIVEVPIMPSSRNTITDSVAVKLDGIDLVGMGTAYFTGYRRSEMASMLRRSDPSKWKDVVRSMHMKGNDRYRIDSISVEGLTDRNVPLLIKYTFAVPGFASEIGDELFVPPVLEKPFSESYYRKGRTLPVSMDFLWEFNEVIALELPVNQGVTLVPEHAEYAVDGTGYSLLRGEVIDAPDGTSTLHLRNSYRMGQLIVQPNELDARGGLLEHLDQDMNRSIILKQIAP
ncbi:MAG: DUF3857 domain-containing protein [Flavobacteriales bacterium]